MLRVQTGMTGDAESSRAGAADMLGAQARVPQHVVYRAFVSEMVILNLETGQYHGLNPTAGRMLEALESAPTVRDAAAQVAADYGQDVEEVERDLLELCGLLVERGLIEIADRGTQP